VRYSSAPAATVFTALIQYALLPEPALAPFVFFYFAVSLVAWLAGRGPGLVAVLLSALVGNSLFLKPYWAFALTGPDLRATLLFVVGAGAVALICAEYRKALLGSQHTAARLRKQASLLERSTESARESEARSQTLAEDLRSANERLREADLHKTEFLGVLSHELRNPLSPIRNSLYILARTAPGSEQGRRSLEIIERQVQQLTRLVDDLLDVTRIARGKIRLQRERVDLRSLATRTAEDYRDLFEKSGLDLEVLNTDEPLFVSADPTRLTQIIGNLLHNAVKFTPQGSRTTLSTRKAGECAEISVQDGGHGIASDVLAHLFEPFAQGEKTLERSAGGLGLGLALVKGLAELHDGTVSAHNPGPGHGARFVVRLPLEKRLTTHLSVVETPPASSTSRRVLVIEDNVDSAQTLKEALELNGHRVEVAYTGPEGLQKAHASRPDVVLCDIGLPGMNGFELAKAMRADPDLSSATLIALSGYALPEDVDQARAAGFDLHLAKPPDLVELERSIVRARPAVETA
jgi:two-component system CheB/CheR fusion protein